MWTLEAMVVPVAERRIRIVVLLAHFTIGGCAAPYMRPRMDLCIWKASL